MKKILFLALLIVALVSVAFAQTGGISYPPSSAIPLVAAGGTVDAITADYTPNVTLTDKVMVAFRSAGANTSTTPSFAPDGLTARTIVKHGGVALVAGDIGAAGMIAIVQYDLANTRWELVNALKPSGSLSLTSITGTAIIPAEVDGHVTSTDLTAAQVSNTVIHNYDQAASDVFLIAPAAAAGYSALFNVVTAQANHWCFEAAANDKIYLIAAAGTVTAGDDGAAVCMMAAQIGQSFACWTFKSGASTYDWMCKAISIGTSTFEAHASSE